MPVGGIVLAGGRSSRMGSPKASLEWHGSTLLGRVAGILGRTLDGPVVVVRARGQDLPRLPPGCEVVDDGRPGRGPLEGLAAGLGALTGRVEAAFVSGADAPLLHPAFVAAVLARLGEEDDICLPVLGGRTHPLAAAYRTSLGPIAAKLLGADLLRLGLLVERCRVRRVAADELLGDARLAAADPGLDSVVNLNGPDDYAAARDRPAPAITVLFRGDFPGADRPGGGSTQRRAATLGEATAAAGVPLGGRDGVRAWLNGRPAGEDPDLPLVSGDTVAFTRAAVDETPAP